MLQSLSRLLVEIHGQHTHLTLLENDEQRRLLDQFGNHADLLAQLNDCYRLWKQTRQQREQLLKAQTQQAERGELLRYQLHELQQLNLADFDYARLVEEHNRLAHLEQILSIGQMQLAVLDEDDQYAVTRLLARSSHALVDLARYAGELNGIAQLLDEALIQIGEAVQELRRFLTHQHANPQQLAALEKELAHLQTLSRKHKISPDQLPELFAQLTQELAQLQHGGEQLEELDGLCRQYLLDYQALARQLSAQRREQAAALQTAISAMLKELGMPHGEFLLNVDTGSFDEPKANGVDAIAFLIRTNPGLPAKPLAKIASGGELSRISLAIQVVTRSAQTTPTLIFDEVDAGIGGAIAEVVGQKLRRLSQNRQVLCVTHLPQVAAQAHQHLFVSKDQQAAVTATTVRTLEQAERVDELARMLGGIEMTENTLAHAREMLARHCE
jgi:DNA repair protein RecN (Recombination protein N)